MKKVNKEFAVIEWNGKNTDLIKGILTEATIAQERCINGNLIINYRDRQHTISLMDSIWLDELGDLYVNLFVIS